MNHEVGQEKIFPLVQKKRGKPTKQINEDENPEIYAEKRSQTKLKSHSTLTLITEIV